MGRRRRRGEGEGRRWRDGGRRKAEAEGRRWRKEENGDRRKVRGGGNVVVKKDMHYLENINCNL